MNKKETYSIFIPLLFLVVSRTESYEKANKEFIEWIKNLPSKKIKELKELINFKANLIAKKGDNIYLVIFPHYVLDVEAENENEIVEEFVKWLKNLSEREKEKLKKILFLKNKIMEEIVIKFIENYNYPEREKEMIKEMIKELPLLRKIIAVDKEGKSFEFSFLKDPLEVGENVCWTIEETEYFDKIK
jgi:hypothetical protein